MSLRVFSVIPVFAFLLFGFVVLGAPSGAQSKPISQTRINEYAAALLKAHRVFVEDVGLRGPEERLDVYIQRIVEPLPGETQEYRVVRVNSYFTALANLTDHRNLCTAVPALRDDSARNAALWKNATQASAALPAQWDRAAAEWRREEHEVHSKPQAVDPGSARGRKHAALAHEITKFLLIVKTAFEALREAQP